MQLHLNPSIRRSARPLCWRKTPTDIGMFFGWKGQDVGRAGNSVIYWNVLLISQHSVQQSGRPVVYTACNDPATEPTQLDNRQCDKDCNSEINPVLNARVSAVLR